MGKIKKKNKDRSGILTNAGSLSIKDKLSKGDEMDKEIQAKFNTLSARMDVQDALLKEHTLILNRHTGVLNDLKCDVNDLKESMAELLALSRSNGHANTDPD